MMDMKEIGMDVNDYQIQLNLFYIELETFTLFVNFSFRLRMERSDVLDNDNHLPVTKIDIYQVLHFRLANIRCSL